MKDTVSLIIDPSPFLTEEERLELVSEMVTQLVTAPAVKLKPISGFDSKCGFYVEFPLYTSFPSNVVFTSENSETKDHAWVNVTVKERQLESILGSRLSPEVKVAYICILVVPVKDDAFSRGDTQKVYDFCQRITNNYLKLYKLLPYFHHHDLTERNNTNSGFIAPVRKFKVYPEVESLTMEGLMLNAGYTTLIKNSQAIVPKQADLLISGFNRDDWYEYQDVMYRLVRAYDFNCYGDADAAIIFSSSAIEGFLMVTELLIRVKEHGEDYDLVLDQVKRKSLAQLTTSAFSLYKLNTDISSQRTVYGKWHLKCYKIRNDIIHRQGLYTPGVSRPAIDASANLMLYITNAVKRKFSKSSDLMNLVAWVARGLLAK